MLKNQFLFIPYFQDHIKAVTSIYKDKHKNRKFNYYKLFNEENLGGYKKLTDFIENNFQKNHTKIKINAWGNSPSFFHFQSRLEKWLRLSGFNENLSFEKIPFLSAQEMIQLNSKKRASGFYIKNFPSKNIKTITIDKSDFHKEKEKLKFIKREIGQSGRHNYIWDCKPDEFYKAGNWIKLKESKKGILKKAIEKGEYLIEDFHSIFLEFSIQFSNDMSYLRCLHDNDPDSHYFNSDYNTKNFFDKYPEDYFLPVFISLICSNPETGFGGILFHDLSSKIINKNTLENQRTNNLEKLIKNLDDFITQRKHPAKDSKNNHNWAGEIPLWNGELKKIFKKKKSNLRNNFYRFIHEIDKEIRSENFIQLINTAVEEIKYKGSFGVDMFIYRKGNNLFWKPVSEFNFRETYALLAMKYLIRERRNGTMRQHNQTQNRIKKYSQGNQITYKNQLKKNPICKNENRFFYLPNLNYTKSLIGSGQIEDLFIRLF
jgi:hypothetical protein